ncbi:hypothetical protein [Scatolibacter rhodanostii]|uniref:hypothetical protein n=1 Tax=Scatolibacter rhodanostii TaxID=2014781 RepID=UPI000C08D616|nr:hypothetical protein [Scatolibacter rhodanostii]
MKDESQKLFRRQAMVKIVTPTNSYNDRGLLTSLKDNRSDLRIKLAEEIRGTEDLFYVFYGSCEYPLQEDCTLLYQGVTYRKLTSQLILADGKKMAVRTVLERCLV